MHQCAKSGLKHAVVFVHCDFDKGPSLDIERMRQFSCRLGFGMFIVKADEGQWWRSAGQ